MLTNNEVKNIFAENKGGLPIMYEDNKNYVCNDYYHNLIIGETGSKKSRLLAMPMVVNLLRNNENVIVSDPKGEIYKNTVKIAKDNNYKVIKLNFADLEDTDSWNPLGQIHRLFSDGNYSEAWIKLRNFCEKLTYSSDESREIYWHMSYTNLLTNLFKLYFICEIKISFIGFYDFYTKIFTTENTEFDHNILTTQIKDNTTMIPYPQRKYSKIFKDIRPFVFNFMGARDDNPNLSTRVGVDNALLSIGLNIKNMQNILKENTVDFEKLNDEKIIFYLITPDNNSIFDKYINLFVDETYNVITEFLNKNKKDALDIRLNYVLDEFANIPKIKNFDKFISMSRSKNIRFTDRKSVV